MTMNNTLIQVLPLGCSFQSKNTPSTSTAIKIQTKFKSKCENMTKRFGKVNLIVINVSCESSNAARQFKFSQTSVKQYNNGNRSIK